MAAPSVHSLLLNVKTLFRRKRIHRKSGDDDDGIHFAYTVIDRPALVKTGDRSYTRVNVMGRIPLDEHVAQHVAQQDR